MLLALALLLVALASAQTTTAVSITTTTTTPVATTAVNVSCDPGLCNYDGNGHGSCEDDLCLCDYGWMGPSCMFPAASGRWATWTFIASVFGVAIPTLVALAALGETYLYLRKHWGALTRAKVPPLITLCALSTGAFARTFYYSLDPFSWRSTVEVCSMWAIDYISTAFVAASFFFVLHGWAAVMGKFEQLNGRRFVFVLLWQWLPMYCLLASGLVVLLTVPGSFLSCHCKDYNCSSTLGDYVFYLPWLVLFGLCLILCVLAGGFMVLQLRRFGINDSHHFTRVFRYSLFVLLSATAGIFTLGFGIAVLTRPKNPTADVFLAIEALNAVALDLLMVGVLLVSYHGIRKPPKRNVGVMVEGVSGPAGVESLFAIRGNDSLLEGTDSVLENSSDDSRSLSRQLADLK